MAAADPVQMGWPGDTECQNRGHSLPHAADARSCSVYTARVRSIYVPLGVFLAQGAGNAGKAELDSVVATQKAYWKIFWEQPEIAADIVTPAQRELIPMYARMLQTPMKDREHSQWQF